METLKTFVPITSKNSASGNVLDEHLCKRWCLRACLKRDANTLWWIKGWVLTRRKDDGSLLIHFRALTVRLIHHTPLGSISAHSRPLFLSASVCRLFHRADTFSTLVDHNIYCTFRISFTDSFMNEEHFLKDNVIMIFFHIIYYILA